MKVAKVHAPVRIQTVRNLRSAILRGEFESGTRLVEKDLCNLTGVSRTSIREALRQLEAEGLVKSIPNKGPIVATLNVEEAREIYQIRQVLEALACKLFSQNATDEQIAALSKATANIEKISRLGNGKKLLHAKNAFYKILLNGCGNQALVSSLRSFHARINFLRSTSLSELERIKESPHEIRKIMDAIERRDLEGAWRASVEHVQKAEKVALKVIESMQKKLYSD